MPKRREDSRFVHFIIESSKYRSICRVCFQTVAEHSRESKLLKGEENHICEGPPSIRKE